MVTQIDMTPDGRFRVPPPTPVSTRILRLALVVAGLAAMGALAALAFWLALTLIPIAIGAGLIAYAIYRFKRWQAGGSFGGGGNLRR